ncbi:tetratricopeptide repeat protein [Magnetococcus sp. PR-3]|uniref:tetratricopeptide repeat protein n=1 Tax=Magnetococcus sp. PR-3 TaxID=3120355 RepID=UPI002FCE15A2
MKPMSISAARLPFILLLMLWLPLAEAATNAKESGGGEEKLQQTLDLQIRQSWSRLNQVALGSSTRSEAYLHALQTLIQLYMDAEMKNQAEPLIQQGLDILNRLNGPNHYRTLKMRILMGKVDYAKGRYERVSGALNSVLQVNRSKKVLTRRQIKEAELYLYLARLGLARELANKKGKLARADQLLLVLIPNFEKLLGTKAPEFLDTVRLRAEVMLKRRRYGDAELLLEQWLTFAKKSNDVSMDERVQVYRLFAVLNGERRQSDKAIKWIDRAHGELSKIKGKRAWQTRVEVMAARHALYLSKGLVKESMAILEKMSAMVGTSLGHHSLKHARFVIGVAGVLDYLNMGDSAAKLRESAEQMGQRIFSGEPKLQFHWWSSLAKEKPSTKRIGNDVAMVVRYMDGLILRLYQQSESVMLWRTKYQQKDPQWAPSQPREISVKELVSVKKPEKKNVIQKVKSLLSNKGEADKKTSRYPGNGGAVGFDPPEQSSGYHVSMGCFSSKSFPLKILRKGSREGLSVYMRRLKRSNGGMLYCAVAGPYAKRPGAVQAMEAIDALHLSKDRAIVFYK